MTVQDLGHSRNHNHINTDICRLLFCGTSAAVQFTRGFSLDPPQRSNEYACLNHAHAQPFDRCEVRSTFRAFFNTEQKATRLWLSR